MANAAPNTGEGASFNTAAKHLFRHLHEPRLLRKNPLVRRFFVYAEVRRTGGVADQVALARIHELIRQAADRYRNVDLLEGQERRALRQHTIVTQQCLDGRPLAAVADELGISYQHCYRQRAEICLRIARYISMCEDSSLLERTPDVDSFRIAMDRVAHRCALTDARSARDECEMLARNAPSATQSIEALRVGALTAMQFGDTQSANEFFRAAQRIYAESLSEPQFGHSTARACIDLIEANMAFYRADAPAAVGLAKRAAHALGTALHRAPERIIELYVASLYEVGASLGNTGDLEQSHQYLCEAEAAVNRLAVSAARLRARVALAIWKVRTYLLLSSTTLHSAPQRHRGLVSAFELAYGSGSLSEATFAAVALAEHHGQGGNDDEALRAGRLALDLAEQQLSGRLRAQASIELALILSSTRHWAFGISLLPDTTSLDQCDVYHREAVRYLNAKRALKSHHFENAWALAIPHDRSAGFATLEVAQGIIAAIAAHRLGRGRDAQALVEEIVPAAERLSFASLLRDAYAVAGSVTGEARFKRRSRELAHLLTH